MIARIYALKEPDSGEIRYVGKTSKSLEWRLRYHINDAKRRRHSLRRFTWILGLLDRGLQPAIDLLEEVSSDGWQDAERRWIQKLRADGCRLLNATDGGDGCDGMAHTEKAKEAIAEKARKRYQDPDFRKRMGEYVRQAYRDPAKRERLKAAIRTARERPGVAERIVAAIRKAAADPERRARLSASMRGRVISEAHRRKLSAAKLGKKLSPEAVEKIRIGNIGLKRSPETKALQSAAQKARFATMSGAERAAYAEERRRVWASYSPEKRAALRQAIKESWVKRRALKAG